MSLFDQEPARLTLFYPTTNNWDPTDGNLPTLVNKYSLTDYDEADEAIAIDARRRAADLPA